MKNESINERIKAIVDDRFGGNVSRFGREVGIKQPTMNTILGVRQSKPSYDVIQAIANAEALFDLSLRWLVCGVGDMYIEKEEVAESDDALVRALLETIKDQQKKIDRLLERLEEVEEELKKERSA